MPSRSARTQSSLEEQLLERVADLEERVFLLESRLRRTVIALKEAGTPKQAVKALSRTERPRCPGCQLELPKGRPGETCVWCGFHFDVVPPRPPRRVTAPPKRKIAPAAKRREARGRS